MAPSRVDGDVVVVAARRPGRTCRKSRSSRRLRRETRSAVLPASLGDDRRDAPGRGVGHVDFHAGLCVSAHRRHLAFRVPTIGMKRRGASQPAACGAWTEHDRSSATSVSAIGRARAYASRSGAHRAGGFYGEPESPTRTPFQRDRDRIIHSTAFRRLKHKTQVFVAARGRPLPHPADPHDRGGADRPRAGARAALRRGSGRGRGAGHDLGHTPFGHAGEEALNEAMAPWAASTTMRRSLRIVTRLERRYAEFDGLNLDLGDAGGAGQAQRPADRRACRSTAARAPLPQAIRDFHELHDLELDRFAGLEAQCAAIADDIAYNTHDIDDGLRAGLLTLDMLEEVPLPGAILADVRGRYPGAGRRAHRSRADAPPDHADGRGRHRDRRGRLAALAAAESPTRSAMRASMMVTFSAADGGGREGAEGLSLQEPLPRTTTVMRRREPKPSR